MEKIVNCKVDILRCLNADNVRNFCIEKNLYTCGDNNDYEKLLDFIDYKVDFTNDDFIKIAIDIYNHSENNTIFLNDNEFFEYILDSIVSLSIVCVTNAQLNTIYND